MALYHLNMCEWEGYWCVCVCWDALWRETIAPQDTDLDPRPQGSRVLTFREQSAAETPGREEREGV